MTHLGYLIAGWGITFAIIAGYSVAMLRRGRVIGARVPADRRRWMSTND